MTLSKSQVLRLIRNEKFFKFVWKLNSNQSLSTSFFSHISVDKKICEKFAAMVNFRLRFFLSEEEMQGRLERDIQFQIYGLKQFKSMIKEQTQNSPFTPLLKSCTRNMYKAIKFLHKKIICCELSTYQCTKRADQHAPEMLLCQDYKKCGKITNCIQDIKQHFLICSGSGFIAHKEDKNQKFKFEKLKQELNSFSDQFVLELNTLSEIYARRFQLVGQLNVITINQADEEYWTNDHIYPSDNDEESVEILFPHRNINRIEHEVITIGNNEEHFGIEENENETEENVVVEDYIEIIDVVHESIEEEEVTANNTEGNVVEDGIAFNYVSDDTMDTDIELAVIQSIVTEENVSADGSPFYDDSDDTMNNDIDIAIMQSLLTADQALDDFSVIAEDGYIPLEEVHQTVEDVLQLIKEPIDLENLQNSKLKQAAELARMNGRISRVVNVDKVNDNGVISNVLDSTFKESVKEHHQKNRDKSELDPRASSVQTLATQASIKEDKLNQMNDDRAHYFFNLNFTAKCYICNYNVIEDDTNFDEQPLVLGHTEIGCEGLNVVHKKCLQPELENYLQIIEAIPDFKLKYAKPGKIQQFPLMNCFNCKESISTVYGLFSKAEIEKKKLQIRSTETSCPFCLKQRIPLAHFKTCLKFGSKLAISSRDLVLKQDVMEEYFTSWLWTADEMKHQFKLQLKEFSKDKEIDLDFQHNLSTKLSENECSYRIASLELMLNSVCQIFSNVKEYEETKKMNNGQDSDTAFIAMSQKNKLPLAYIVRRSRDIPHKFNCSKKGYCLSGFTEPYMKRLFQKGMEIVESLLDEEVEIFSCLKQTQKLGYEEQTVGRKHALMNTFFYSWTCNRMSSKHVEQEDLKTNAKSKFDILISGKVASFEMTVRSMKNLKRNKQEYEKSSKKMRLN